MIEKLRTISLQIDILLDDLIQAYHLEKTVAPLRREHGVKPLKYTVTLDLVKNEKVLEVARMYIMRLLTQKEKYGYLYFLNSQNLLIPLNVQFNGEMIIERLFYEEVLEAIHKLASEFACPETSMYELTRVELLYFFVMLMNREFNWVSVDYLLQGNKSHSLLVAHPSRRFNPVCTTGMSRESRLRFHLEA